MSFHELLQANRNNPNIKGDDMGRNVPPRMRPKAPENFQMFKRREMNYDSRKLLLKNYWNDVQFEYTEANHATNIYNMFCEILESMPQKSLKECYTLVLFENALKDTIGKDNITVHNKPKKYI